MFRTQSFLSDEVTGKESAASALLSVCPSEAQSIERLWTKYKNALDSAAREVLAPRVYAKKPWITQATLPIIDQR